MPRRLGENTRAAHLPRPPSRPAGARHPGRPHGGVALRSAEEYTNVLNAGVADYSCGTIDNPTLDAFAAASRRGRRG
jgi:hypothetical protein